MAGADVCADHRDPGNAEGWETPARSVRRYLVHAILEGVGRQMGLALPVSRPERGRTASANFTKCQFCPGPLSSQGLPPSSESREQNPRLCNTPEPQGLRNPAPTLKKRRWRPEKGRDAPGCHRDSGIQYSEPRCRVLSNTPGFCFPHCYQETPSLLSN